MSARCAVAIDGLRYSYGDGRTALDGISLTVAPGMCVALVGPNGAGKSTLLLHLNGLLRGRGRITISGLELRNDTLRDIRRRVGLVFQDPDDQLFMPTCVEDVAFGPMNLGMSWDAARERALEALAAVGMAQHAERAPHQLSLGQRKRVAIATVLAMQPDIVALDEPTAGLDPRSRRGLIDLLRDLPATRLLATHDLAMVAELCERVIVLDEGEIVADDTADRILADAALLSAHGLEAVGRLPVHGSPGPISPHPLESRDASAPLPERGA